MEGEGDAKRGMRAVRALLTILVGWTGMLGGGS
jgi:hypothetical protein